MTNTACTAARYRESRKCSVRARCEHVFATGTKTEHVREESLWSLTGKTPMPRRPGGETEIRARIAASSGLTSVQAHTLAGFLDAEGSLAILPNNRDGWRCECSVYVREDDRDVLIAYRTQLGLGHLTPVAARNGSRPQVCWRIGSKLECDLLVELLDKHPLRARKRAEYEIWRQAVRTWAAQAYGFGCSGRGRLADLAAHLKAARAYRNPAPDSPLPDLSDSHAPHYFAGFFSGEGSFGLGRRNARFVIKLRRDDRPLLQAFRASFGIGTVCDVAVPEPWSPAAIWHVTGARDVLRGIVLFEAAGLLGRKERQYRAWRPGALAIALAVIKGAPVDAGVVSAAREALTRVSEYCPPSTPLDVNDGAVAARRAYREVLRRWASSAPGVLSCTAYAATRHELHPEWPQRETLAREFGSWFDALRFAGLEERAARRPSAG
jgi:hypothetical protein